MKRLEEFEKIWILSESLLSDSEMRIGFLQNLILIYDDIIEDLKQSELFEISYAAKRYDEYKQFQTQIDNEFQRLRNDYLEVQKDLEPIIEGLGLK